MNKTNIYIVGAGTYGPVIYELTEMLGFNVKSIYDDDEAKVGLRIINASVIGSLSLSKLNIKEKNFAVAIGNNFIRRRFCDNIEKLGGHLPTLIHPRAEKSPYAKIGKGCFIHAMTYIWTNVSVGDFCIISPKVIVSHDTNIESGCFVSYGANVGSGISIGENNASQETQLAILEGQLQIQEEIATKQAQIIEIPQGPTATALAEEIEILLST